MFHSAALYKNYVVIFGGDAEDGPYNDMYMFNIHSTFVNKLTILDSTWRKMNPKEYAPPPRCSHTAVTFGSRMIVYGGCNNITEAFYGDVEVFDFNSETWTRLDVQGAKPKPRCAHSAVICDEKHMAIFGGFTYDSVLNDVYLFHISKRLWTRIVVHGDILEPRCFHSAVKIADRQILVFGGWDLMCKHLNKLIQIQFENEEEKMFRKKLLESLCTFTDIRILL